MPEESSDARVVAFAEKIERVRVQHIALLLIHAHIGVCACVCLFTVVTSIHVGDFIESRAPVVQVVVVLRAVGGARVNRAE